MAKAKGRTFQEIIEAGGTMGWHSFDQCLLEAYENDVISDETAMIFCAHKNKMRRDIDMLQKLARSALRRTVRFTDGTTGPSLIAAGFSLTSRIVNAMNETINATRRGGTPPYRPANGEHEDDFREALNHKLRTPLNAIIGFAELLSLQADPRRVSTDVAAKFSNPRARYLAR